MLCFILFCLFLHLANFFSLFHSICTSIATWYVSFLFLYYLWREIGFTLWIKCYGIWEAAQWDMRSRWRCFFFSAVHCHLSSITVRYTANHITDLLETFFPTDRFWSGCDSIMMMMLKLMMVVFMIAVWLVFETIVEIFQKWLCIRLILEKRHKYANNEENCTASEEHGETKIKLNQNLTNILLWFQYANDFLLSKQTDNWFEWSSAPFQQIHKSNTTQNRCKFFTYCTT